MTTLDSCYVGRLLKDPIPTSDEFTQDEHTTNGCGHGKLTS